MQKLIIVFSFLILTRVSYCQNCSTNDDVPNFLASNFIGTPPSSNYISANGTITIRIVAHIVQNSAGTIGVTEADVYQALQIVQNDFNIWGICFSLARIEYELNDDYISGNLNVLTMNNSTDALDIYFMPLSSICFGYAPNNPGHIIQISGTNTNANGGLPAMFTHMLSHEIGHCLSLYHTFHGQCTQIGGPPACAEYVNGGCVLPAQCGGTCGDYVADTPVDPCMDANDVSSICLYDPDLGIPTDPNGDQYHPDPTNIMSYSNPPCINSFTAGQAQRMKACLMTGVLNNILVPNNVFVQNISNDFFCYAPGNVTVGYNVTPTISPGNVDITIHKKAFINATEYIEFQHGFNSDPSLGGVFVAEIDPLLCGYVTNLNLARLSQNQEHRPMSNSIIDDSDILIYPNPTSKSLICKSETVKLYKLKVINLTGTIILERMIDDFEFDIDVSSWYSGCYFLYLVNENNKIIIKKFFKI